MRESDIIYERGQHWVIRINGLYHIMKNGVTHSTSVDGVGYDELDIAITRVDYLERRRIERFLDVE